MFHFQKFTVEDDRSTMKVGTDAMILGAWTRPPEKGNILEIGTGCGVISLMLAQKSEAAVTAIDIHGPSAEQAAENFRRSPWGERLKAVHVGFEQFSDTHQGNFGLIITNPPFFSNALPSPVQHRNEARHDFKLTFDDILVYSNKLLEPEGRLIVILPEKESGIFEFKALEKEFSVAGKLLIFTMQKDLQPVRIILELTKEKTIQKKEEEKLVIRNSDGTFSPAYLHLTKDFHKFTQ